MYKQLVLCIVCTSLLAACGDDSSPARPGSAADLGADDLSTAADLSGGADADGVDLAPGLDAART
jgi:hypothetical protein